MSGSWLCSGCALAEALRGFLAGTLGPRGAVAGKVFLHGPNGLAHPCGWTSIVFHPCPRDMSQSRHTRCLNSLSSWRPATSGGEKGVEWEDLGLSAGMKLMASLCLPPLVPFALVWGHVISSGQWTVNRSSGLKNLRYENAKSWCGVLAPVGQPWRPDTRDSAALR